MSRKNRKQRDRIRTEPTAPEVFSKDGYVNRPAFLGEATVLGDVNWIGVLSAGAFGAVTAMLLALTGLPEVE